MEWIILLVIIGAISSLGGRKIQQPREVRVKNQWDESIDGVGISANSSWNDIRIIVFKRDNYTCKSCRRKDNLTVDHIVQLSQGGTNNLENLQTLCKYCHEEKDNRNIFNRSFNHDNNYGSHTVPNQKILDIEKSIKTGSKIKIMYTDINLKTTHREITPSHFTKEHGIAYLVAFCHLRKANRTFRISRIKLL